MATPSQIEANRENAKKSTGPVTPEGKARSSRNHFSHGFTASTSFIRPEDPDEFYGLMADLQREYEPATPTEQILVEKMFHHQLLSLRAIRLQTSRLAAMQPGDGLPKDLALLIRYHTTADRGFHKAHAELVKTQRERKMSEIGFVPRDSAETLDIPAEKSEIPIDSSENPPEPTVTAAADEPRTPKIIAVVPKITAPVPEIGIDAPELPQAA